MTADKLLYSKHWFLRLIHKYLDIFLTIFCFLVKNFVRLCIIPFHNLEVKTSPHNHLHVLDEYYTLCFSQCMSLDNL